MGRASRFTDEYKREAVRQALGLGFSVWTLPSLQAFMECETGVKLSQNRLSEV